ncbi:Hypothetical_protein [Hexamita inflata]|uniref:Hypothetical_protein n=1 Tax=Hexamita inflata TaxID=28002 RepID=A0AA86VSM0_9EUKA|nr:Hypothetical protein HINF_LOCUS63843 [Hexamita inflata]
MAQDVPSQLENRNRSIASLETQVDSRIDQLARNSRVTHLNAFLRPVSCGDDLTYICIVQQYIHQYLANNKELRLKKLVEWLVENYFVFRDVFPEHIYRYIQKYNKKLSKK